MIRDRGKMKWTAMMMPEHVGLLRKYAADDDKTKKPELDEQELEEINCIIYDSLNYTMPIRVEIWENGYFKRHEGIVDKIDYLSRTITLDSDDKIAKIPISNITKTERL